MRKRTWRHDEEHTAGLDALADAAREIGYLVVEFPAGGSGRVVRWLDLEPWTRSRAVTVAVVAGTLASPGLDAALCSDLVYLRPGARLRLSSSAAPPSDGVIWALGRAGRAALARGLLEIADVSADEAVRLGIANAVVAPEDPLPLPAHVSEASLTAARDLLRSSARGTPGLALELASFRLLFAAGDPAEGARAFLEKRDPTF